MMTPERVAWEESIQRNGEIIAAALDGARAQTPDDADAGNALAFAVALAIPYSGIEDFVASLRAFATAKRDATN